MQFVLLITVFEGSTRIGSLLCVCYVIIIIIIIIILTSAFSRLRSNV